ncbi:MAG: NAD-dependent epimerase/dehydratase family protein [Elusimicrobiota bacterium]
MNAQKRKKLVVLGSSGFIGRHFLSHAAAGGYDAQFEIVGVDKVDIPVLGVRLVVADISDRKNLERILVAEQPEYIVNLAGIFQGDDMDRIIAVNATLSKHLMDIVLAHKIPVTNILLIGSAAEYDVFMRVLYRSKAAYIEEPLAIYRKHAEMCTKKIDRTKQIEEIKLVIEKFKKMDTDFVSLGDFTQYAEFNLDSAHDKLYNVQ